MNSSETANSRYLRIALWTAMFFTAGVLILLWMSWQYGTFPFAVETTTVPSLPSGSQMVIDKSVLDSLTASSSTGQKIPGAVLKTLTAKPGAAGTEDIPQSVLDSLAAPN